MGQDIVLVALNLTVMSMLCDRLNGKQNVEQFAHWTPMTLVLFLTVSTLYLITTGKPQITPAQATCVAVLSKARKAVFVLLR